MTPYFIVQTMVSDGPKSRQEIIQATGWDAKKASGILAELVERRDIRRIARGVYAMPGHSTIPKKRTN